MSRAAINKKQVALENSITLCGYFNYLSCHEIRRRVSFPINSSSMLLLGSTEPKLDLRTGLLTLSQLQNSYNDQGLRAALDINILCIHLIPVRIRFQVVHAKYSIAL